MNRNPTLNLNLHDDCDIRETDLDFLLLYTRRGQCEDKSAAMTRAKAVWRSVKARLHTYRCVESMAFLIPKVQMFEGYDRLLGLYRDKQVVKVADIGCCFGQDVRRLLVDGIPPSMIWAIDVVDGYWSAGLELYQDIGPDKSEKADVHRIDLVHTLFCDLTATDIPSEVSSTVLTRDFDCLILKNVFHVLSLEQGDRLMARMAQMLHAGGFIMGICVGAREAKNWALTPDGTQLRYLHSISTLSELFRRHGFHSRIKVMQMTNRSETFKAIIHNV